MKKSVSVIVVFAVILVLPGCTPVKFYSTQALTGKTGLKCYTVKPFLLVERDSENNRISKVTALYLPDLSAPQYMAVKDGIGSRKVDVKLTDGSINTFGLTSDTKLSETIASLASLVSKGSSAITDLSTLKSIPQPGAASTVTELYEVFMTPAGTTVKKIDIR